jgi:predicted CXXCH cytochrome family protein
MADVVGGRVRFNSATMGLALLAIAILAFMLWVNEARRAMLNNPLVRARGAYAQGNWSIAADAAREALKRLPDDPDALRLLARSYVWLGRDETALAIYTRRLDSTALQPEDHVLMGMAYERRGQTEAALHAWSQVQDTGQVSPQALDELARRHLKSHRREEAAKVAQQLGDHPGWEARGAMMLGTIRAGLNDVPGAAESFRRALKFDPTEGDRSGDPAQLRKLIARTFLRSGSPGEARTLLEPILARGSDREAAWLLSRAFLQQGDATQAREALAQAGTYRAENPLEAEPAPYVGETRCEPCHAAIFRDSLASRHTQSYYRGPQLRELPRPDHPLPDPDNPEVTHTILERDGALREQTRVGRESYEAVIEYAFGTRDRYLTMVGRDSAGGYRIARLSYHDTPEGRGWARSALDKLHPDKAAQGADYQGEAIGVRDGVAKCLYCHVTNPRSGRDPTGPETADRAIGCERCHGPGGHHAGAIEAGLPDTAIVSPADASPESVTSRQCNDCHILGRDFRKEDLDDPAWVRSQGVGWTFSRCNTESGGAFGCVTCHDPHKSARATTTAQYEASCLSCHAAAGRIPTAPRAEPAPTPRIPVVPRPSARPCPVNPAQGCVHCHMPPVRIDSLHLNLADHYIRIRRPKP